MKARIASTSSRASRGIASSSINRIRSQLDRRDSVRTDTGVCRSDPILVAGILSRHVPRPLTLVQ